MITKIYVQGNTLYVHRNSGRKRTSFQIPLLLSDSIHIIFYDRTHLLIQRSRKSENEWFIRAIYKGTRYHTVEREKSKSNNCLQSAIFSIQEDEKIFRLRKEQLK